MRLRIGILFLSISTATFAGVVKINDSKLRPWTNFENNIIHGTLVKYDSVRNSAYIRRSPNSGASFWYPINRLCVDDKNYILNSVSDIENRLPDGLYDEGKYETLVRKSDWNWYDLKYFKMDDPVTLTRTSHLKYVNKTGSKALVATDVKVDYIGNYYKFIPRGKYRLPVNYGKSATNLIYLLHSYGVSKRDLAKLKWFFSAEDVMKNPTKILSAYGFEHYVGSYNPRRVKSYIDMGLPLLAVWTESLKGNTALRYLNLYHLDPVKESEYSRNIELRKVHYLKLLGK
tara:strand:+ start:77072 stop:77932 length:861 start_codon:yes stop_codon:yes gene_type:complete